MAEALTRSQRARRQRQRNDIAEALRHAPTKRLLGRILDVCGIYDYPVARPDELLMQAGRRAVGLEVRMMLEDADPYAYAAMVAEAAKAKDEAARAATTEKDASDVAD